ncbi:DUF6868 family protein [Dyella koreensis]|uniref:DUF6868 domain-containing protein n=1 Tax=Dyella koreensis TaxID=311235 RepID=A0ABW8K9C8_9GAMM
MTTTLIKDVLIWCVVLNYIILLAWAGVFIFARDWMYRIHGRWFKLSDGAFDAIHYGGMAVYKIGIILFNLIPLVSICLAS